MLLAGNVVVKWHGLPVLSCVVAFAILHHLLFNHSQVCLIVAQNLTSLIDLLLVGSCDSDWCI